MLYVTYSVNNSAILFFVSTGVRIRTPSASHTHSCLLTPTPILVAAGMPLSRASLFTSLIFTCNMVGKLNAGLLYDGPHGGAWAVVACSFDLGAVLGVLQQRC